MDEQDWCDCSCDREIEARDVIRRCASQRGRRCQMIRRSSPAVCMNKGVCGKERFTRQRCGSDLVYTASSISVYDLAFFAFFASLFTRLLRSSSVSLSLSSELSSDSSSRGVRFLCTGFCLGACAGGEAIGGRAGASDGSTGYTSIPFAWRIVCSYPPWAPAPARFPCGG